MTTEVTQTFAALADPVRSAIVDRLITGDATVGQIAEMFPITIQAVSQQIGTLERAGLVTRHREGRSRRVHLEAARIERAAGWLEARRQRLEERYQRLDDVLADVLDAQRVPDIRSTTANVEATSPGKDPA